MNPSRQRNGNASPRTVIPIAAPFPPKRDPAADGWPPLPTTPQVRRRCTDALPWRPQSPRMRWER